MILNTHYIYGSVERATIVVRAPTGSNVTATLGSTVITGIERNGVWTFNVTTYGVWTIKATLGSNSATTKVNVTSEKVYNVTLAYTNPANGILADNGGKTYVPVKNLVWRTGKWFVDKKVKATFSNVVFSPNTTTLIIDGFTSSSGLPVYIDNTYIGKNKFGTNEIPIPSSLLSGTHTIVLDNSGSTYSESFGSIRFNV